METEFESMAHKITSQTFVFAESILRLRQSSINEAVLSYSEWMPQ